MEDPYELAAAMLGLALAATMLVAGLLYLGTAAVPMPDDAAPSTEKISLR
jgi:hypothetical protein